MEILSPILSVTLAETVAEKITEAIVRGELEPGKRLTEPMLAEMLKVSRSPIREALGRLENAGLIVRDSKNGLSVWDPTEVDVDEILSLRVIMESLAAEIMIEKLQDEDLDYLERIFEAQKQAVADNRHLLLTKEDKKFHAYLIERSKHARLLEIWNRLMGQMEVLIFRRIEFDSQVSGTVLIDHRKILDAIKSKDLDGLIRAHKDINARVALEMKKFLRS